MGSSIIGYEGSGSSTVVVKSDTTVLPVTKALYVGVAGDLVVTQGGSERTFKNAAVGYHPLHVTQVKAATVATNILALY
jgi:hypothetical protein